MGRLCYTFRLDAGRYLQTETNMNLNQEAKNMIAIMALVGALALLLNDVALASGGRDMLPWSLGLLLASVFFWIWMRRDALADKREDAIKAAEAAADEAEALAKRNVVKSDDAPAAAKAAGSEPDDLTKIRGIAESYQLILNEAGITSYSDLASATVDELRAIFRAADRSVPVRVETVPRQAELAAKGDWDGLRDYLATI